MLNIDTISCNNCKTCICFYAGISQIHPNKFDQNVKFFLVYSLWLLWRNPGLWGYKTNWCFNWHLLLSNHWLWENRTNFFYIFTDICSLHSSFLIPNISTPNKNVIIWSSFWGSFCHVGDTWARSKLRLCSANHRPGYWSNLPCDWPSTAWAYSEQETENGPWSMSYYNELVKHSLHMMMSSNGNIFGVTGLHKGKWCGALMFSLICTWIKVWVNNREAGDLRHQLAHYDVTVMSDIFVFISLTTSLHGK